MDSEVFRDLNGYERGVIARALLENMIKRGCIADESSGQSRLSEILIPLEQWEMKLLACFRATEEGGKIDAAKETSLERIREILCPTR